MRKSSGWEKAIASAAVALGLTGNGTVAGDTVEQQGGQQTQSQSGLQALVFVNDYKPTIQFRVVSRIQQPTVNRILGYVNPASPQDSDGAVVDPTDWNGYIINYVGCGPGNYNLLFVREGWLQQGQTFSFTTNAVYFSNQLQLLESQIRSGGATAQDTAGTEEEAGGATEAEGTQEGAEGQAQTEVETTPEGTTPTPDGTTTTETTTPGETTTTTPNGTTTTETETETTTAEVVVNATETEDGE